jgi:hypothetical protein
MKIGYMRQSLSKLYLKLYNYCFTCFTFSRAMDRRLNYNEGIFEVNIGIV